jgi:transposase
LIWIKIGNDAANIMTSIERRQKAKTRFSKRETRMLKFKSLHVVVAALSIAMPLGVADMAFAAKKQPEKLTYEQAWAKCKKYTDVLARDQEAARYARGASCMHKYGYNP